MIMMDVFRWLSVLIQGQLPVSDDTSDSELIQSVIAGRRSGFKILVERYQQRIFSYLFRFLYQNREAAEDITQSVFLKLFQNLATIDLNRPLPPWLYRIAHNEAANYLRSVSRRKESQLDDVQWGQISRSANEVDLETDEERRMMMAALHELKPKYREVLILYYFEEKPYEEIALILNTSTNTVGTLLRRARNLLKKTVEKQHEPRRPNRVNSS